jgi:hypothetical protein
MAQTRWLPDDFDGCVVIHDAGDAHESVTLVAGDEIPDGVVFGSHIKTVSVKPRITRQRELDAQLAADQAEAGDDDDPGGPDFDPRKHNVAEVTAYLQQNPGDAGRVFALEERGQRRAGILGGAGR